MNCFSISTRGGVIVQRTNKCDKVEDVDEETKYADEEEDHTMYLNVSDDLEPLPYFRIRIEALENQRRERRELLRNLHNSQREVQEEVDRVDSRSKRLLMLTLTTLGFGLLTLL